jgi:hypothetical protein
VTPDEEESFHDTLIWARLWDRELYEKLISWWREEAEKQARSPSEVSPDT